MSKFKVGDKVRCAIGDYPFNVGDITTVANSHDETKPEICFCGEMPGDRQGTIHLYNEKWKLVFETPKRDPLAYIKAELAALKDDSSGAGFVRTKALEDVLFHGYGIAVVYTSTTTVTYEPVKAA